ncbi:hypothetical protein [Rhizobium sp.]
MQSSTSWSEVDIEVDRLCVEHADIDSRTASNAKVFVAFAAARYPAPDDVGPGYYPTINFSWIEPFSVSVEVFEERYEFYRFFDRRIEIKDVDVSADQSFPEALMRLLDGVLLDPSLTSARA